jgi:UDP-N-acetylglucosamine:LPS N-acetylglucosamine transferase
VTGKKRFLILTSDSGFGHRSAANSVAKALDLLHPGESETTIVNPIHEDSGLQLLKETERNYDYDIKNNPIWFRFTYSILDSRPASLLVENTLIRALSDSIRRLIDDLQPDTILNTNQLFNAPAGAVLDSMTRRPPFYTVVTDLADVHTLWFNPQPDHFFVASKQVRAKAVANGIPSARISISGIPVDPDFKTRRTPQPETRRRLGLDPQLTTLLFVGSRRVSGIFEHLEALENFSHPLQAIVITGGDDDLLEKICAHPWSYPLLATPFVTNIPEWMECADILVTKAGGLILSEGFAAGLPVILIDSLPGQEEGNVRFTLDHRAGVQVEDPRKLPGVLDTWLQNDGLTRKSFASASRRLGNPDAAFVIADALYQAAVKKTRGAPASPSHRNGNE